MSHLDSLAGLDSMVLHINTRSEQSPTVSTLIAMDSESFVLVPRKIGKLGRASRTPLADKTPDFNTNISPSLHTGISCSPDFSISIYRDRLHESASGVAANHLSRFPSFKPLPLVPAASPLRTSFLNLSIHSSSSPESNSEPSPPTIPSSILPQRSCADVSAEPLKKTEANLPKIHDEPFLIPAFQHPNSPYVPWAPPVRRKILRSTSPESRLSGFSSNPFSRGGARAPEPAQTPKPGTRRVPSAPNGWGRLREAVLQGVNRVASRLVTFKRPFSVKRAVSPCDAENHVHSISQEDDVFSVTYSLSPHPPMAVLSKRHMFTSSTASLASSDSRTLTAWLATRKQAALEERDYEPGSMMTLDEYERMGSWLDMSGDGQQEGRWLCGVPGCEIHANHMTVHSSQVTSLDFSVPKDTFSSGPSLQTRAPLLATFSPQVYSLPQSQTRTLMCSTRQKTMSGAPSDGNLPSAGILDRRGMENNMPGGWTS